MPKLLGVSTMPRPKCHRHTRLTMTRDEIGCLMISSASSRRPLPLVNSLASPPFISDGSARGADTPNV